MTIHTFNQKAKACREKGLAVTLWATLTVHPSPKAPLVFLSLSLLLGGAR